MKNCKLVKILILKTVFVLKQTTLCLLGKRPTQKTSSVFTNKKDVLLGTSFLFVKSGKFRFKISY